MQMSSNTQDIWESGGGGMGGGLKFGKLVFFLGTTPTEGEPGSLHPSAEAAWLGGWGRRRLEEGLIKL